MKIYNLTQHNATPTQTKAGVVELTKKGILKDLLTFNSLPNREEIEKRAKRITHLALEEGAKWVMIGGALWLMPPLIEKLKKEGIVPLFSFSVRKTEELLVGEEVKKVSIFEHIGWVEA